MFTLSQGHIRPELNLGTICVQTSKLTSVATKISQILTPQVRFHVPKMTNEQKLHHNVAYFGNLQQTFS